MEKISAPLLLLKSLRINQFAHFLQNITLEITTLSDLLLEQ